MPRGSHRELEARIGLSTVKLVQGFLVCRTLKQADGCANAGPALMEVRKEDSRMNPAGLA